MDPIRSAYGQSVRINVTGIAPAGDPSFAVISPTSWRLSKDLVNQASSSFSFTIEAAEGNFNQFRTTNPLQHGAEVVVELNDISGGILTDPLPVDGWIKKFTGNIVDPGQAAGPGPSRSMSLTAYDKMWSVINANGVVYGASDSLPRHAHMTPIDDNKLIWQIIDLGGNSVLDLNETILPIITRYVRTDASTYAQPFPAGPMTVLTSDQYTINYTLGRVIFKDPQDVNSGSFVYAYDVFCSQFVTTGEGYLLEDAWLDFLTSTYSVGGPQLTYGTDFDFEDLDGDSRFANLTHAITAIDTANDEFDIAGDQTSTFIAGYSFTVINSTSNNGVFTVTGAGSTFAAGTTTIPVTTDVVASVALGTIRQYVSTRIRISSIEWDEDSGTGDDFMQMLKDAGVMPFNYFLRCDENNKIIGRYFIQSAVEDTTTSGPLFVDYSDSFNEIYTRAVVMSTGNVYPKKLLSADNAEVEVGQRYRTLNGNVQLEIVDGWQANGSNEGILGFIDGWQRFGDTGWDNLFDDNTLKYVGIIDKGEYKYSNEFVEEDEFFYPFPNRQAVGGGAGSDALIFADILLDDVVDIDKIVLSMQIPAAYYEEDSADTKPGLYIDGNSDRTYSPSLLVLENKFGYIKNILQLPIISVVYGKQGETPQRSLGKAASFFTMDPVKGETKVIKTEGAIGVRRLRIIFHRPFVCDDKGNKVAIYMLNNFQAYDRGVLMLPVKDANNKNIYPFARITGTTVDSSLISESGSITTVVDNETITVPNGSITEYSGLFLCVPSPGGGGDPYIAEILYNNRDVPGAGTQTIKLLVISGKSHTDLTLSGVQAGDDWYLMHNRYWLDLLYDRQDLYKLQIFTKMTALNSTWKTVRIENNEITDLGACLRKAVTSVIESVGRYTGIATSMIYRPDFDTGMTVKDTIQNTPLYMITAIDYIGDSNGIITPNTKFVNFDQGVS